MKVESPATAPVPKYNPASPRRDAAALKAETAPPSMPQAVAPPPPPPPRPAAKASTPAPLPTASRPTAATLSPTDERIVLIPLLVLMLVFGGLLASRLFARRSAPAEKMASATVPAAVAEPEEIVLPSEDSSDSEPAFLEDLRFRESLFQKGFSKPKRISNRDIVVDIDSYEVGKEL